ncbi:hypothetical protein BH23DEI1_BH23DEI1_10050 [soil metagenome]
MYVGLLHLHNLTRWLVLIAAVVAVGVAIHGLVTRRPWTLLARKSGTAFVITLDVQLVLGLLLYVVSPIVRSGFADMATAMADGAVRFFLVEHLVLMILAVAAAHVGSVLVRRAPSDRAKHARAATWYSLALALVLLAIPWWRPLFPGLA